MDMGVPQYVSPIKKKGRNITILKRGKRYYEM
jgi:hypothetical protein